MQTKKNRSSEETFIVTYYKVFQPDGSINPYSTKTDMHNLIKQMQTLDEKIKIKTTDIDFISKDDIHKFYRKLYQERMSS